MQSHLINWALISFLGLGFVGITGVECSIAQESISNGNAEADALSGHVKLIIYSFPNPLSTFSIYAASLSRLS